MARLRERPENATVGSTEPLTHGAEAEPCPECARRREAEREKKRGVPGTTRDA